jgi:SPP1 family predicted phage head-tail adaptor
MAGHPDIGRMRHRLVLEYPQRKPDGAGGHTTTWLALADIWARLETRGRSERVDADGRKSRLTLDVIVRARPEIMPSRRFRSGTRLYDIHAVEPLTDDGAYLIVRCETANL